MVDSSLKRLQVTVFLGRVEVLAWLAFVIGVGSSRMPNLYSSDRCIFLYMVRSPWTACFLGLRFGKYSSPKNLVGTLICRVVVVFWMQQTAVDTLHSSTSSFMLIC